MTVKDSKKWFGQWRLLRLRYRKDGFYCSWACTVKYSANGATQYINNPRDSIWEHQLRLFQDYEFQPRGPMTQNNPVTVSYLAATLLSSHHSCSRPDLGWVDWTTMSRICWTGSATMVAPVRECADCLTLWNGTRCHVNEFAFDTWGLWTFPY